MDLSFLGAPVDWSCITKKVQVVNKAKLLEYKRSVNFGNGINQQFIFMILLCPLSTEHLTFSMGIYISPHYQNIFDPLAGVQVVLSRVIGKNRTI